MLDDLDLIIHELEPRDVTVHAISDVHLGSKECELDKFKAYLKKLAADPNAYVVLCGDIINNGVKNSLTNVYEEVIPPSAQVDLAVELLAPLAQQGKILAAVSGNHEARSRKEVDLDPMFTICAILRIPELYRQNMAFVRIRMKSGKIRTVYTLMVTHGKSRAKMEKFQYSIEGVDAIISGHTHDAQIAKPARIVVGKDRVSIKPIVTITATSWLGLGGYGLAGLYTPKSTSCPQHLLLEWKNSNAMKEEIRVIW